MENEFNIEEVRKLREEVEALRRDVAQLNGRLDVIESLFSLDNGDQCIIISREDLDCDRSTAA